MDPEINEQITRLCGDLTLAEMLTIIERITSVPQLEDTHIPPAIYTFATMMRPAIIDIIAMCPEWVNRAISTLPGDLPDV